MLLSLKSMQEIYQVAQIIYDVRCTQISNKLTLNKNQLKRQTNANNILEKLSEQYEVITIIRTAESETENCIAQSYDILVEECFEEFHEILRDGVSNNLRLTDKSLTFERKDTTAFFELSDMGKPTVKIGGIIHHFPTMKIEDAPFKIIYHCLNNYTGLAVSLSTIRNEIEDPRNLININETLRKSKLFGKKGPLSAFVDNPSPKHIVVHRQIKVDYKSYEVISNASNEWQHIEFKPISDTDIDPQLISQ